MAERIKAPKAGEVLVRMYRQGLGDCFLLTFRGEDGGPVHVLIDCGVWDADAATVRRMRDVVADIEEATGGTIHLLVVTHEHWDHVSGFLQAAEAFGRLAIDNVWLAWTEDSRDTLARQLKAEYEEKRTRLRAVALRLARIDKALAAGVEELLGVGVKKDPAAAMAWVRKLGSRGADVRYCRPGDVLSLPGSDAARAFVLGPPRERAALRRNRPTKTQKDAGEVYLRTASRLSDESFLLAAAQGVDDASGDGRRAFERSLPFDSTYRIPLDRAGEQPFFGRTYRSPEQAWRTIDDDWLQMGAELALWLDDSTNNTSLVLAFRLAGSGRVLLFVGDAQVGNWLTWDDVVFEASPVTARDLLADTVLYKVGHHGSHNATLRRDGVERMIDQGLVAMIPVNRESVEKKKWKMPFPPLNAALLAAAGGRVLRADDGLGDRPPGVTASAWKKFTRRVRVRPLYVEYRAG